MSATFASTICQKISSSQLSSNAESRLELDSHADSPVLGRDATIVMKTGRFVSVRGFTDELGAPIRVPVVSGVIAYECKLTGKKYLLHVRNSLHIPSMNNHLIPPIMMRLAGVIVNECPKFLSRTPSIEDLSIYFPEENLRFPLLLSGTTSYLPVVNSKFEVDNLDLLELTPQCEVWNPHTNVFQEQEEAMMDY